MQQILSQMKSDTYVEVKVGKITDSLVDELKAHSNVSDVMVEGHVIKIFLVSDVDNFDDFVKLVMAHEVGLLSIQKHQAQLEDVFIEVTKK